MQSETDTDTSWGQTALRAGGLFIGLAALAGLLMGGIVLVARFLDNAHLPANYSSAAMSSSTPTPPVEQNARTRAPTPYAPQPWPDSPGRKPTTGPASAGSGSNRSTGPQKPSVPVGLSVDEYRAATASGKKIFLPNPQGECDLSGTSTANSISSLESCFAKQAAR